MKSLSDEFYHEIEIQPERELKVQQFYCSPGFEINSSDGQTGTQLLRLAQDSKFILNHSRSLFY